MCVLFVGRFEGVSVQQVALCCVSVCVCVCVCVRERESTGNYITAVLRTIHLFHEGLSGYLEITTWIKTLTILTTITKVTVNTIGSPYHHCHNRGINWFRQLIFYCTSSQSTCQLCLSVKRETNKNVVITGIMWLSKFPHVSRSTYCW